MKKRNYHDTGLRHVKKGKTQRQAKADAKRLGIPYGTRRGKDETTTE